MDTIDRLRLAPDYIVLPCGCETGTVDLAYVIRPCSLLCRWYLFTIGEADRQGQPPPRYERIRS